MSGRVKYSSAAFGRFAAVAVAACAVALDSSASIGSSTLYMRASQKG
jgi:hypothetical protein